VVLFVAQPGSEDDNFVAQEGGARKTPEARAKHTKLAPGPPDGRMTRWEPIERLGGWFPGTHSRDGSEQTSVATR
jgi:hypothetical protein